MNAANPAAPPPAASSLTYIWTCTDVEGSGCPPPVDNSGGNATFISFAGNTLVPSDLYELFLDVSSDGTDPNYQSGPFNYGNGNAYEFDTTCLEGS